jgi:very-short-patch-repair endonuclease
MSLPERMLWGVLRGKSAGGLRWRKQHPMSEMTLDFYCASAKLAVEVDGEAHGRGDQPAQDVRRDAWLAGQGVRVCASWLSIFCDRADWTTSFGESSRPRWSTGPLRPLRGHLPHE